MALLRIQARTVIKKWNLNTNFVQILEPLGSNFGEKLAFNAQQFHTHGAQRKKTSWNNYTLFVYGVVVYR